MTEKVVELVNDRLIVANVVGGFKAITPPEGITPRLFRNAVSAFDTAFRRLGRTPNIDEVFAVNKTVTKATLRQLVSTKEFKQAMSYRGIELDELTTLSIEQQHVLLKLSDPYDRRMLVNKLRDLGVPMPKFQAWLKNPVFFQAYEANSIAGYKEALPAVRNRLISEAEAGKMEAIKLLFEKTGEWSGPGGKDLDDAQAVVLALVEAIAKHAPLEMRKAIMAEVGLAQAARLALEK